MCVCVCVIVKARDGPLLESSYPVMPAAVLSSLTLFTDMQDTHAGRLCPNFIGLCATRLQAWRARLPNEDKRTVFAFVGSLQVSQLIFS